MLKPLVSLLGLAFCLPLPALTEDQAIQPTFKGDRVAGGVNYVGRSAVVAPNGAAATAHPLATQTAIDILKAGGSAVDAAIAANAMLGLVEPTGNGIGGDLFAMVWDPKTQKLYGLNASGRSPMGATLEDMKAAANEHNNSAGIPPFGAAPVSVPGAVDGWFMLHEKFGKTNIGDLLAPAIGYAESGAPIPEVIAYYWGRSESRYNSVFEHGMLEEVENANDTYFSPTPTSGSLFKNPDLASTYAKIAEGGRDAFYKGGIAKTIDAYMKRIGGFVRYEDLAAHQGEWVDPLCIPYHEAKVCGLPPNTQGVATLQMLQMLENFPMREFGFGSADSLMAQVEAKRLAFADRAASYADPDYSKIDPVSFIEENYATARASLMDLATAKMVQPGLKPESTPEADADKLKDGDTTYLSVTDKDGMMVSLIQSNYRGMGSGLVPDGLGFMLQNRGELFSLDTEHPNVFEPGKRPFHTIIPGFAFKKDFEACATDKNNCAHKPWLTFGVMGGGMQPQGQTQIILNLIDYDMGLQEAGDAARWRHDGSCQPTDSLTGNVCESSTGVIKLESGHSKAVAEELRARGHTVEFKSDGGYGGYQAIMRDFENDTWIAATEMRKDGAADGY